MNTPPLPPTLDAVFARWASHSVSLPHVYDYDPSRLYQALWLDRSGAPSKLHHRDVENDTAWPIAHGEFTNQPKLFAIFAIHAFLIYERAGGLIVGDLNVMLLDEFKKMRGSYMDYWHANAVRILPFNDEFRFKPHLATSWEDWVDGAAAYWNYLERNFAVLRMPARIDEPSGLAAHLF